MAISLSGSLELTGSLTVTGGINMSGSIASASYASNAELLDGRDSLTFANTGSNSFVGSQNINGAVAVTGSLTTTGVITAQSINVQQVTSSIVYSSGSNIFGNSVSNTQSMTGSVGITGSLSVNGVSTLQGALSGTSATFSGIIATSGTGLNASVRIGNTTATTGVDWHLYSLNNGNFGIYNNTAGAYALQISSTGAATFSSDVNSSSGFQGRYSRIFEASAQRGGLYPYNLIFGSGTDYSVGLFSEGEIYMASGGSATKRLVMTTGGNVGIGTTSPDSKLHVAGTILIDGQIANNGTGTDTYTRTVWYVDTSNQILFENGRTTDSPSGTGRTVYFTWRGGPSVGGGVQLQHGANAWAAYTSDARLKTKVADVENGLSTIMQLEPIKFKWSRELENSRTVTGFTAQNIEQAIPDAVFNSWKDEKLGDVKSYYQDYLVPYLVKAIQEQQAQIEELKLLIK